MSLEVQTLSLPDQHEYKGEPFPPALKVSTASLEDACGWVHDNATDIEDQASKHGAVLIRGLPLASPEDFDAVVTAFGFPNFSYEDSLSNAYRINYTPRVFSANEAPPEVTIFLHHEMAQTPIYPSKLFFFCQTAPDEGGATPICRSDILWERLHEQQCDFAETCLDKGLKYSLTMAGEADKESGMGRSWQSTFGADSREAAEARMTDLNYTWQWQSNGDLRATTPVLPAVRDLGDGRCSFFNQLIAASQSWNVEDESSRPITFGDDSELDLEAVTAACQMQEIDLSASARYCCVRHLYH